MNTKTTKFLAVLAVLAMVFASVAAVTSLEQNDADDATTVTVDGIEATVATSSDTIVDVTVSGKKATFVGLFDTSSATTGTSWYSGNANLYAEVDLTLDAAYTKAVITDSAYRLAKDNGATGFSVTSAGMYQFTDTTTGELEKGKTIAVPVPKDASSVVVQLYTGSTDAYVLAKTITLDFSDAFTRIVLSSDAQSQKDITKDYSSWKYTNSNTTLALVNYSGNEVFKSTGALNVTIQGDCTLAYVLPDGTTLTDAGTNGVSAVNALYSGEALTITKATSGSLTILADLGDGTTVKEAGAYGYAGALMSVGAMSINGLDDLVIDVTGSWEWAEKEVSAGVYGIWSVNTITVGTPSVSQDVDISVTPDVAAAHGIFASGGNNVSLYVNGSIVSSSAAICMNGGSGNLTITNSGSALVPLVLTGSEKAIQTKNCSGSAKFVSSHVSALINDAEDFNKGDNFVAGISTRNLESKDSYIYTEGLYFHGTAATLTYTSGTAGDVIEVSGNYTQNPDSKVTPAISGLWVDMKNTSTIKAYTGVPEKTSVISYILLDDDAATYGNLNVLDSKDRAAKETFTALTNLTTSGIESSYATEIIFAATGASTTETEIVIPVEKTVTMNIGTSPLTGASSGTVFKCGDVSFTLASGKGFVGMVTINKDGIVIDGATQLNLSDVVGSVTIKGTINNADGTSIAAKEGKDVDVTFAKTTIDGKALTITGADVVIPKGVIVTVNKDLEIVKGPTNAATLSIAGTATVGSNAKIDMDDNTALTVASTGKIIVDGTTTLAVSLGSKASADIQGVLGSVMNATSKTTKYAAIANGAAMIAGLNVTGFKVVYDSDLNVTGSITSANKYYSGTTFTKVKSAGLTIGEGVVATVGADDALTMTGDLVINGTLVSSTATYLVIGSQNAAGGSMTVNGKLLNAATATEGCAEYTVAGAKISTANTKAETGTYLYGYTVATEQHSNVYYPVISGSLTKYLPAKSTDTAVLAMTLTAGTLYTKDTFAMGAKTSLVIVKDGILVGKINAPEGNAAIFNVMGGEGNLTITAGSLDISGNLAATTDTTKPSVEIVSGETVTLTSVKNNNATIAIDNGVEAKVKTDMEVGEGKITVKDGALLDFEALTTAEVKAKTGTGDLKNLVVEGEVSNSAPAATNVISTLGLKAGAVYNEDGYFYEVFDSTVTGVADYTFAVGVKDYKYNGEAQLTDGKILTKITKISGGEGDVKFSGTGTLKSQTYMDVKEYVDAFTTDVDIGGTIKTISVSVYITPFEFTVTFDPDKGAIKPEGYPNPLTYQVTDKTTKFKDLKAFPTATELGFVFDGWEKAGQADVFLTDDVTIFEASNSFAKTSQKVKAIYTSVTEATYTVSFVENGGSAVDDQEIKYGDKVDETETITIREGFVFDGWYTEEGLINKFNFRSAVTGDITLYAGWIEENVADSVDIAVSFTALGIKVTIAGEGDLNVPVGDAVVTVYYWKTVAGITYIDDVEIPMDVTTGKIVFSDYVVPTVDAVYVMVEYASASGEVSAETPLIYATS